MVIVIAGPDGSGKSALVSELLRALAPRDVLVFHHRPELLPRRTRHVGPVREPHAHPPYPRLLSLLKLAYLFVDFQLGWWLRVAPAVRRGAVVLLERGWWDMAVDQRRYRLQVPVSVLCLFGRLLPKPHATLVLTGCARTIHLRKAELPIEEVQRQLVAWRALPERSLRPVYVDVARESEAVAADLMKLLQLSVPLTSRVTTAPVKMNA